MKVSDLIDQLNRDLKLDDQIIVAYWDKSTVEQYAEVTLTDEKWIDIVSEKEAHEPIEFDMFGEKLQEIAMEVGQSIYDEPEGGE